MSRNLRRWVPSLIRVYLASNCAVNYVLREDYVHVLALAVIRIEIIYLMGHVVVELRSCLASSSRPLKIDQDQGGKQNWDWQHEAW